MGGVGESAAEAFDRGHTAGEIAVTLADHAAHLRAINGSTEKTARALEKVAETLQVQALELQRLADQAEADARTRVATAVAVKETGEARVQADEEARRVSEREWVPWARLFAVVGACGAIVGLVAWATSWRG